MVVSPTAGGFHIHHHVFLIRIGEPRDADDLDLKSGFFQRLQLDQLVPPNLVALGLDLHKSQILARHDHEIRKPDIVGIRIADNTP